MEKILSIKSYDKVNWNIIADIISKQNEIVDFINAHEMNHDEEQCIKKPSIDKQLEDILEDCFGEYLKIHGMPFKDRKIDDAKRQIKSVCGIKE